MTALVDERRGDDRFVGRRRELAGLRAWLQEARGGRGRLVLVVGEPGIGKTRLAQELAVTALAEDVPVAWGRCAEAEGTPAYWPWRQVLVSLEVDVETLLAGGAVSPEERFRLFDGTARALAGAARERGLVVVVDDVHWADEPSLLLLCHLAERVGEFPVLLVAALRDVGPPAGRERALPELLRAPRVQRLDLRGLVLDEVRDRLGCDEAAARAVLETTGGNPFFIGEVARAIADGSWQPDRPPRSVLDVVSARIARLSPEGRRFVQAAAVVGRDFRLAVVAAVCERSVEQCLAWVDEAAAHGLISGAPDPGCYRFVHALVGDAVERSLAGADRLALHEAAAHAIERQHAGDLREHLAEVARHWLLLAPYGHGPTARAWASRAAEEAVRRLAFEEGARLYRAALTADPTSLDDPERCRIHLAIGRAAYLAGDQTACVEAATQAATAARRAGDCLLLGDAALTVEAVPDPAVNALARGLCEEALAALERAGRDRPAMRSRLLAQLSHLAYYAGDQPRTQTLSNQALTLARRSGEEVALVDALRARQESLPGSSGRAERLRLAAEILAVAARTDNPRTAMWGELWRIEALAEDGRFAAASDELPALRLAAERIGGPVPAWHCDRVAAGLAQAQGRFAEAAGLARRAYDRMRPIEAPPATGAFFALHVALAQHVDPPDELVALARSSFTPPPLFRTMRRLADANLLLRAGCPADAAVAYAAAGPLRNWSLPPFFELQGKIFGVLAAVGLEQAEDLAVLAESLEAARGEHAVGNAVAYFGPTELALGRAAAALGRLDDAVTDLSLAAERAENAGAPAFAAEARYYLAAVLVRRGGPGDREVAEGMIRHNGLVVPALGMSAEFAALPGIGSGSAGPERLSAREAEVAALVAAGLTNRQIAQRLVISERTAQNHVQHILTKLEFSSRSQIAAWFARGGRPAEDE